MQAPHESLEMRIARLERLVEELLSRAGERDEAGAAGDHDFPIRGAESPSARASAIVADEGLGEPAGPAATRPGSPRSEAVPHLPTWRVHLWDGEFWLNKLGIGLVLFGVTFLFLYSIEQGWLTPEVRVGFGALVGSVLLGAGLRMGSARRSLAQVLLGGGIGVFYIVGFAAFQLYDLLGYHSAFAFMVAVTVLAFWLSLREDHPVLALIGAKGALGTPFLLYRGDGDVEWLVSYSVVVMASSVALFVHKEWRSLVWTAALGGWAVHLIGYGQSFAPAGAGTDGERWVVQATIVFGWILFAVLVPAREHHLGRTGNHARSTSPLAIRYHLHLLAAVTPLAALGLTGAVWSLSGATWGWSTVTVAALYAAGAAGIRRRDERISDAYLFAAGLLVIVGSIAALPASPLFAALAVQAFAIHSVARRIRSGWLAAVGHVLTAGVAMWFIVRLDAAGLAGSARALADPVAIAATLLASREIGHPAWRRIYRGAAHLAILALLWRELAYLSGGAALVSAAWAGYALLLLASGARLRSLPLQKVAVATILALVAKLFLVDLAALDALWRILLFLGIGSVLLASSYALQGVWRAAGSALSDR